MLIQLSPLALGAWLLLPAADAVPKFNYEPICREAAKAGEGLDGRFSRCMAEEENARKKLQEIWSTFTPSSRASCAGMSSTMGIQSYVELQTCLEIERDAAKMEKKERDDAAKIEKKEKDAAK
jgi:hypothetical protein